MNETLKQIDTRLIEFLGKRIAVLAQSNPPSIEEQIDGMTSLLDQVGVPEFVWKNIVTSCLATLATLPSYSACIKPRRVTVIGGRGMMGHFFTSALSKAGHKVNILEHDDWEHADRLLAEVDLVLVCVPIEHTLDVIHKAAMYLEPTTGLADITSIKTHVVEAMLECHTGPVFSLHPMFGSSIQSFMSQNVVICPGRNFQEFQWFLQFIENEGGHVIICTPEEHDQMMVVIQAIRHFCAFSVGVFLAEEGIDLSRSLKFSSAPYRLELDMVSRLLIQDVSLHLNIMLASEERCEAIDRLANTYRHLANLVAQKDQTALKSKFEAARSFFRSEATRASQESDRIIDHLSILLAANKVEHQIH
jgi:prephenate dehydrogenase